jgi:hypothetical protein
MYDEEQRGWAEEVREEEVVEGFEVEEVLVWVAAEFELVPGGAAGVCCGEDAGGGGQTDRCG